jgi:hypothetical protein
MKKSLRVLQKKAEPWTVLFNNSNRKSFCRIILNHLSPLVSFFKNNYQSKQQRKVLRETTANLIYLTAQKTFLNYIPKRYILVKIITLLIIYSLRAHVFS